MIAIDRPIWIFHAAGAPFAGAAFDDLGIARDWIAAHRLSGVLTAYPLNRGVFDWAFAEGVLDERAKAKAGPAFVGGFTSASQPHFHFEDGQPAG